MIDKFYYVIAMLAAMSIGVFVCNNVNHRQRENTLPRYEIKCVDAFHVDSTGKFLLNWKGDTCGKRKTKLEE